MTATQQPARTRKTRPTPRRRPLPRITLTSAIVLVVVIMGAAKTWPVQTGLLTGLIAVTGIIVVVRPRRLAPLLTHADALADLAAAIRARRHHLPKPGHRTRGAFLALHPTQFEQAITALAREDDRVAHAEHVGRTADRGIDVLVTLHNGWRILVQCKHHTTTKNVGGNTVREIAGSVLAARCHAGVIVTTTGFTAEAMATNVALGRNALALVDGNALVQWANGGHAPW